MLQNFLSFIWEIVKAAFIVANFYIVVSWL